MMKKKFLLEIRTMTTSKELK